MLRSDILVTIKVSTRYKDSLGIRPGDHSRPPLAIGNSWPCVEPFVSREQYRGMARKPPQSRLDYP
jgi:hypothetical protein